MTRVLDNSKAESVNPYAPPGSPAAVGKSAVAFQWTIEAGLVGDPTAQHLKTHLAIEQSVTALSILGVLLTPVILLPLHLFKPAVFVMASGVCGSVFLAPIVSMVQYRAALFKNNHPPWMVGKFVLRELRCSMETHGFFIAGVGLASRLLPKRDSFFPPGQSKCHVLVGKRMLQFATPSGVKDEWRSLRGLVQFQLVRRRLSLIRKQGVARDPSKAGRNVEFIFDRERGQTVPIEAGAFPVSGVVNTKYVERRPATVRESTRMMRSLIVVALAFFLVLW
ncbi:hypothetical protein OAG60_00505 [bacterium]|nr:hypothetical protein [bacterium]